MTALFVRQLSRVPWKTINDPEKTDRYPVVIRAESLRASGSTKGQLWERVAEGKKR